jgi:hypothetical protein
MTGRIPSWMKSLFAFVVHSRLCCGDIEYTDNKVSTKKGDLIGKKDLRGESLVSNNRE